MKWDSKLLQITVLQSLLLKTLAAVVDPAGDVVRKVQDGYRKGFDRNDHYNGEKTQDSEKIIFTVAAGTGKQPEMQQNYYGGRQRLHQLQHDPAPPYNAETAIVWTPFAAQSNRPQNITSIKDRYRSLQRQPDVVAFVTLPPDEQLQFRPPTMTMENDDGEFNNGNYYRHHASSVVQENKNNKRRPTAIHINSSRANDDSNFVDRRRNNHGDAVTEENDTLRKIHDASPVVQGENNEQRQNDYNTNSENSGDDGYDFVQITTSTDARTTVAREKDTVRPMVDVHSNNSQKHNKPESWSLSAVGGTRNVTRPNNLNTAAVVHNGLLQDNNKTSRNSSNATDAKLKRLGNDNHSNVVAVVTTTVGAAKNEIGDAQNHRTPLVERAVIGFNRRRPPTFVGRRRKVQQSGQRQTAVVQRPFVGEKIGDGQNYYGGQNVSHNREEKHGPFVKSVIGDQRPSTLTDVNNDDDEIREPPQRGYGFEYAVLDEYAGTDFGQWERREPGQPGVVTGQYRVKLPDGRTQTVVYSVDADSGYKASVTYEGVQRHPTPQRHYDSDASATTGTTAVNDVYN
ncbi:Insect cuticle protein [Cinara cedri]|uniref:Insect cuticle protein n=1 Tax=Cinara cedri TaxID=506608 RepID=A0A5E4NKS6_9HEMI|nr:Insect cuticle protein [Cinara cedri]